MKILYLASTPPNQEYFDNVMKCLIRLAILSEDNIPRYSGVIPQVNVITTEDISKLSYFRNLRNIIKQKFKSEIGDSNYELPDYAKLIKKSDGVIIENSIENFNLGYIAALAVENRKPVLILSQSKTISDWGIFTSHFTQTFQYNQYSLLYKVNSFVKELHKTSLSKKINLFISKDLQEHIHKQAKHKKISNSEFIRRLIEDDIIRTRQLNQPNLAKLRKAAVNQPPSK